MALPRKLPPLPVPSIQRPLKIDNLDDLQRVVCWLAALGQTGPQLAQGLDISQRIVELKRNQAAKTWAFAPRS